MIGNHIMYVGHSNFIISPLLIRFNLSQKLNDILISYVAFILLQIRITAFKYLFSSNDLSVFTIKNKILDRWLYQLDISSNLIKHTSATRLRKGTHSSFY